ncbi:AraC family transcriptional regulator [Ekhidna sp.]|uniref:AraC family transcriptional regulator n=1 Tax=Ekhidna sp. TaxID=2608089 RepID=UPI003298ACA3
MERTKAPAIFLVPENSSFELNFQSHYFENESAVFVPADQFILTSTDTKCFPVNPKSPKNYRYLFSRVLSVGHVAADEKIKATQSQEILDYSTKKWKSLNPFNTNEEELEMLFDTNEWLDQNVEAALDIKNRILSYSEIQRLSKEKLNLTLFQWKNHKLINQARQTLFESGGSIKETSYTLGFKDTAYFCRFFRNNTTLSPGEFFKQIADKPREKKILNDFKSLLKQYVDKEHQVVFYANQLNLTPKSLSRLVKSTTGKGAKKHIEAALISKSKSLLKEGHAVGSVAFGLGFEEISHFSNFFKHYTHQTPSELVKSTIE